MAHMTTAEALDALERGTHTLAPGPKDDPYPGLYQRFVLVRASADEKCPHCSASLLGNPIPEEDRHLFGETHFSRKIGMYDMELDRTVAYCCPDCRQEWKR